MSSDESTVSNAPTTVEKLRGLPWGVVWSVANSVFAQYTFFGSIFVLFLNELGLDKSQIGSLLSLLPFFGILAVFIVTPVARMGYKRAFLIGFGGRASAALLLLLAPTILVQFGQGAVLSFIVVTLVIFGIFRSIGFTAYYPWQQEQIPDSVRGKYTAIRNVLSNLVAMGAMLAGGLLLGPDPAVNRFLLLISIGVAFGAFSVGAATKMPGGAPTRADPSEQGSFREMLAAARDRNFVRYLFGLGLVTAATGPLTSFVPLFMKEQVGLNSDQVVWLDTAILLGGLVSSYLWGWLADRYGSKPVMTSGVYLLPLLPLAWLLMPQQATWSLYLALGIAIFQGFINTGWTIGSGRLLFVRVVPTEKSGPYMALYYAWAGIAGGLGQLLGGWLVENTSGLSGQWWILRLNPYTPLFLVGMLFPLIGLLMFRHVKADSSVTTRQFAGMFLRGNPVLAMESLVRYHRARDERAAVAGTERLGSTGSPLTVEELIEALHDPRFYVRFEAVVSIARRNPDPRLTDALIEILEGNDPALSTIAAWALGRIGDQRAVEALHQGLNGRYRSVQAHCARSLGNLDDQTIRPVLLERLAQEEDIGLQMAYASALGRLGAQEAIEPLLGLLRQATNHDERVEYALALARLVGDEHHYIQFQRRVESEPGTTLSQATTSLKGKLAKVRHMDPELETALESAADALAREDLAGGIERLSVALRLLPQELLTDAGIAVLHECVRQMEQGGAERLEYSVLVLHALDCEIVG